MRATVEALQAQMDRPPVDPEPWQWYAPGCPCGLEPGECAIHPRARPSQRPPDGDWRTWLLLSGRAAGKTRSSAELVRHWAETTSGARIGIVGATAADTRDTLIEGPSGLLTIAPPWAFPKYEPSKRRLTWPNGAVAIALSADQPERARGLQFSHLWLDELCAYDDPFSLWKTVLLCLRHGGDPRIVVSTTPKPIKLLKDIIVSPTTRMSRESTFANAKHVAPGFIEEIASMYAGTRLGQQELYAEIVDTSEASRFPSFSAARHVREFEVNRHLPVYIAADAGTGRHFGALLFQVEGNSKARDGRMLKIVADYYARNTTSADNARSVQQWADQHINPRMLKTVYLDPAAYAWNGSVTASVEFQAVFPEFDKVQPWAKKGVAAGLDLIEILFGAEGRSPNWPSTRGARS